MRFPTRSASQAPPGVFGTLRAERPTKVLLDRLRPGDIAVIDHVDLDRTTAQALLDAGVVAVVNAQPMLSGRYPNLGPHLLAEAGVVLVDNVGEEGYSCLVDGGTARIYDGTVYDGTVSLTEGRVLDLGGVLSEMEQARDGLGAQLETFTHNSTELLRREQDVLLHGIGLPEIRTSFSGHPAVVIGSEGAEQVRALSRFVRDQRPVLVAVGQAADAVARLGRVDVVVIIAGEELPSGKVLRGARDVLVVGHAGVLVSTMEAVARFGVSPRDLDTALSAEDVALLVAHAGEAEVIVCAGMPATLTDFLEKRRPGMAGSYLTRLVVGPELVDARAVGLLYSGRVKGWQVLLALLVCVLVVAAALVTTDVGHRWAVDLGHHLHHEWQQLHARMQGRHA